jgi:hypothetical protein
MALVPTRRKYMSQGIVCSTLVEFLDCIDGLTRRNIAFTSRVDSGYYIITITGF